jgi:hypothetical protein
VEPALPAPFTIETGSAFAGFPPLEDVVLAAEVEDVALLELAAPDPATTTMVPTIVVGWIEQKYEYVPGVVMV